jgi:hypothetical protein
MTGSLTGCGNAVLSPAQVTMPDHFYSPGGREALLRSTIQQNGQWLRLQLVTWPSEDYCWAVIASGRPEPAPLPNASSSFPSPSIQLADENQEDDCVDETLASQSSPSAANSRGLKRKKGQKQVDRSKKPFHDRRTTALAKNQTQSKAGQEKPKVCQECNETTRLRKGPDETRICEACYMIFLRAVKRAYNPKQGNDELKTGEKFSIALAQEVLSKKEWAAVLGDFHKRVKAKKGQEKPSGEMIESGSTPTTSNSRGLKRKRGRKPIANYRCHVSACNTTQSEKWYGRPDARLCSECYNLYRKTILNEAKNRLNVQEISLRDAKAELNKDPGKWEAAMERFRKERANVLAVTQTQSKEGQEKPKVCQECNKTEISSWRKGPDKTKICGACYMIFYRAVKGAYAKIPKQANDMLKKEEQFSVAAAKKVLEKQGKWEKVLKDFHKNVQKTRGA